jgi:DNA-binding NarL/FixJ family response regulator
MTKTLRVVIAEDNYLVREGVRRLLEDSGQVDVVSCVGDARELLDAVRRLAPNAVLTDIRMPPSHHMEGIEAARAIRTEHPETGVVVLSQHTDESYARALFNDGSAGLAYLLKDRLGSSPADTRVQPFGLLDSARTGRSQGDGPGQDQCRH